MSTRNNSFSAATDLGSFGSSSGRLVVRDSLSSSDKVGFFKLSVLPGGAFSRRASFRSNGDFRITLFVRNPLSNAIERLAAPTRIRAGRTNNVFQFPVNPFPTPVEAFIRLDRPASDLNVRLRLLPLPAATPAASPSPSPSPSDCGCGS